MGATILLVCLPESVETFVKNEWGDKCRFVSVSNPFTALEKIVTRKIDAVASSHDFAGLTCYDLIEVVRKERQLRNMPFALFSKEQPAEGGEFGAQQDQHAMLIHPKTPKKDVTDWFDAVVARHEEAQKPPELDQDMAAAIESASRAVMGDALGMQIELGEIEIGKSVDLAAEIMATVNLYGFVTGTVTVLMNMPFARLIGRRLLGCESEEAITDTDVVDAIGEVTNMIAGKIKVNLCNKEDLFYLCPPAVVVGKQVRRIANEQDLTFRQAGKWEDYSFLVELSLIPNKVSKATRPGEFVR